MSLLYVSTVANFRYRVYLSTIKHADFDVSLAALPFTPACAFAVQHLSPEPRAFRGRFPVIGEPRLAASHFSKPTYTYPRFISRSLSPKELRSLAFIASSDDSSIPSGCLISHPLNTFFIARLTISDNARSPRKERGKVR